MQHDYAGALQRSLLFYRAQRSGDLSSTQNPIPWRAAPSFLSDGCDVGIDLSRGYFDAGDYIKYGQPAAYSVSVLAWSGIEFATGLEAAGSLTELKSAVRWGTDYMLNAASHLQHECTYYAQIGRGPPRGCSDDACKFDHGYWGRPEDYERDYAFASLRRTYPVNASRPGIEVWASASAALMPARPTPEPSSRRRRPLRASALRAILAKKQMGKPQGENMTESNLSAGASWILRGRGWRRLRLN